MKQPLFFILCFTLFLSACTESTSPESTSLEATSPEEQLMEKPTEFKASSLNDLDALFERFHYTLDDWKNGVSAVPRLTFQGVVPEWQQASKNMQVEKKKSIFFRLILPLILVSNENILSDREIVQTAALNSEKLVNLAIKYRVIKNQNTPLTKPLRLQLLKRVNTIPPSLALAQAAEESGWGTSRFALEGNAFFGQWDFSGKGIKPKQQRKELGNYGIASFDSPLASVEGYMLNINTGSAYQALRDLRAEQVMNNKAYSGILLAGTLINYSERREEYIRGLRTLIRYNKLEITDQAHLSDNKLVHIVRH